MYSGMRNKKQIKPEKQFEQLVRAWCIQNNIWIDVFDSKATFTERGVYKTQGLPIGTPDLLGFNRQGKFVVLELKDPAIEPIPSLQQWNYLARAIDSTCFAMVVNSIEDLSETYKKWQEIIEDRNKIAYLRSKLPKKAYIRGPKGSRKVVELIPA